MIKSGNDQLISLTPSGFKDVYENKILKWIIASLIVIFFMYFIIDSITTKTSITYFIDIIDHLITMNTFAMTFIFIILTIITVIVGFPTGLICLACGYMYCSKFGTKKGVLVATIVSLIGNTLGSIPPFYLAKWLGSIDNLSRDNFHPVLWGVRKAMSTSGQAINILLRLTFIPTVVLNYGLPLLGTNLFDFVIGGMIGSLPYYIVMSIFGGLLQDTAEIKSFVYDESIWIVLPVVLIALLSFSAGMYLIFAYVDDALQDFVEDDTNIDSHHKQHVIVLDEKSPLMP